MSDIKRQITIQLKVVADKQVKAEVESLKKVIAESTNASSKIFADAERKRPLSLRPNPKNGDRSSNRRCLQHPRLLSVEQLDQFRNQIQEAVRRKPE